MTNASIYLSYSWDYENDFYQAKAVKRFMDYMDNNGFKYDRSVVENLSTQGIEEDVKSILRKMDVFRINYMVDKRDVQVGDSINDFEVNLAKADIILLFISFKSLTSIHCLEELFQIVNTPDYMKRVLPIMVEDPISICQDYFRQYPSMLADDLRGKTYLTPILKKITQHPNNYVRAVNTLFDVILPDLKGTLPLKDNRCNPEILNKTYDEIVSSILKRIKAENPNDMQEDNKERVLGTNGGDLTKVLIVLIIAVVVGFVVYVVANKVTAVINGNGNYMMINDR